MNIFQKFIIVSLLFSAVACSPKVDTGGYVREEDVFSKIKIGKTTRDEVTQTLGSPSSQSSFGEDVWYYVTDRKEGVAFLKPEVVEQQVVGIGFNDKGIVSSMQQYDKKDSEDVSITHRTTPTEGHTMGFFEQVLGNIGRFNRGAAGSATPGRKPTP